MASSTETFASAQLQTRRGKLKAAIQEVGKTPHLTHLLQEVDAALGRIQNGSYGLCEACHESIEEDRLMADPLVCFCLDHLTADQQRALEQDLELASRIQRGLLPKRQMRLDGWEVYYHYEPFGAVSGDYCDLLDAGSDSGDLYFLLGDVAGKGVAASMLMANLHAIFRSLVAAGVPANHLAERANRVFAESTMATYFATLVCGRAGRDGRVEICNAGHCPPLWLQGGKVTSIDATGLPLGMFSNGQYSAKTVQLAKGESLFLYTDGLVEARNASDAEYGTARLAGLLAERHSLSPQELADAGRQDLKAFLSGTAKSDDLTMMVIRRGE
jgi:sigma-B regulation protein RsbU (phosphoserine phosphatase)